MSCRPDLTRREALRQACRRAFLLWGLELRRLAVSSFETAGSVPTTGGMLQSIVLQWFVFFKSRQVLTLSKPDRAMKSLLHSRA
jgi:hypothetical protein